MKRGKRGLAALLSLLLLISTLSVTALAVEGEGGEEPQTSAELELGVWLGETYVEAVEDESGTLSLLPLEEKSFVLDLSGRLPDELAEVNISEFVEAIKEEMKKEDPDAADPTPAVWMKWSCYDKDGYLIGENDDDYHVIGSNTTLDLTNGMSSGGVVTSIELIVGSENQFDPNNVRWRITITTTPWTDPLVVAAVGDVAKTVSKTTIEDDKHNSFSAYCFNMDSDKWNGSAFKVTVKLDSTFQSKFPGLTLKVYEGYDEIGKDITDVITGDGWEKDYLIKDDIFQCPAVTAQIMRGDSVIQSIPFYLFAQAQEDRVTISANLYDGAGQEATQIYDYDTEEGFWIYQLKTEEAKVNDTYYVRATCYHNSQLVTPENVDQYVEKAVVGRFESLGAATGTDIKGDLFGSKGFGADFSGGVTITVFLKNGRIQYFPIKVAPYPTSDSIWFDTALKDAEKNVVSARRSHQYDEDEIVHFIYEMKQGKPANATYSLTALYLHNSVESNENYQNYVKKAVDGYCATIAEMSAKADISSQLFGDGYSKNYSTETTFTIQTTNGLEYFKIKAIDYVGVPVKPDSSTTFLATGALKAVGDAEYKVYDGVKEHDGYWAGPYNYQTLFIMNEDDTAASTTKLVPTFTSPAKAKVFVGQVTESGGVVSGAQIVTGENEVSYTPGVAIPIQVNAEDGKTTENYYVTYLTPVEGSHLFVNGATNSVKKNSSGEAEREVRMDARSSSLPYHDIFLANYGTEELTGLKVNAAELAGVELDEYWTIKEGSKLAAFTTVDKNTTYGELPNVGKVRLVPTTTTVTSYILDDFGNAREEIKEVPYVGPISGKVTISAANGDTTTMRITGNSGAPEMLTTELLPGVQFVHYSCVLMTNCNVRNSQVKFECIGDLPKGLSLKQNGEIYGVPQEAGDFEVEVRMWYEGYKDEFCTTTKLPIHIDENDDAFVDAANEGAQGYPFKDDALNSGRIPDQELSRVKDQVLYSTGVFTEFVNVYLDGKMLTPGTDYIAEDGSTKITVQAQTFRNAGTGKHTISAEFRVGGSSKTDPVNSNNMKRTAQNFTITGAGGSSSSGGGGSSGGGYKTPVAPGTQNPSTSTGTQQPGTSGSAAAADVFKDITWQSWFQADVDWAYQKKLMLGVTADMFEPYGKISPTTVVVVLARMSGADLSAYEGKEDPDIEAGKWYTTAALWAKETGLLPAGAFTSGGAMTRGQMAAMLTKYLKHLEIDCTLPEEPVAFADAALMTPEENEAFQILYQFGVFKGIGNYTMDVAGSTTRAQFAVLLHRLSVFAEGQKQQAQ